MAIREAIIAEIIDVNISFFINVISRDLTIRYNHMRLKNKRAVCHLLSSHIRELKVERENKVDINRITIKQKSTCFSFVVSSDEEECFL